LKRRRRRERSASWRAPSPLRRGRPSGRAKPQPGLGIALRRAALEQKIVLHAFDPRERADAQVGKRPVRRHDRVPSLGTFEMAKWEQMVVRLDPSQRDVG
jgi:hypothetical protein